MPKVSAIISAYNAASYLPRCLGALLNHNFKDIEIILVDNASTDSTESYVRSLSQRDPRVKYYKNESNIEIFASLLRGIELASGEYFTFSDADDYHLKNSITILYNEAKKHGADIVSGDYICDVDFPKVQYPSMIINGNVLSSYLTDQPYSNMWVSLFHRSIFEKARAYYPKDMRILNGADYLHSILLYAFAQKKVHINRPVYRYFIYSESVSHSVDNPDKYQKLANDLSTVYRESLKFLNSLNIYESHKADFTFFSDNRLMLASYNGMKSLSASTGNKIYVDIWKQAMPDEFIQRTPYMTTWGEQFHKVRDKANKNFFKTNIELPVVKFLKKVCRKLKSIFKNNKSG